MWMQRGVKSLMVLALGFAAFAGLIFSASPVHAAPVGGDQVQQQGSVAEPVYTHRSVTTINFAGTARCAQLKQIYPAQAANPALCTATITSLSTDLLPLAGHAATIGVGPYEACVGGSRSYNDTYTDPLSSSIEMRSTFTWYYNCQPPKVTFKDCWVNWLIGTEQHEYCSTQYPNSTYSDLKHSVVWNPYAQPWLTVTIWQMRTAYWDGSTGYCTDLGGYC